MKNLLDNSLESCTTKERENFISKRIKQQFDYNKNKTPFHTNRLPEYGKIANLSYEDLFKAIPYMTKSEVRNAESPMSLVANDDIANLRYSYSSSGTTGKPAYSFFSEQDNDASIISLTRTIPELQSNKQELTVYNGYNQAHISGPLFNSMFRHIGGLPVPRRFGISDEVAYEQITETKCNILTIPWTSTNKGGSLEDLLSTEAKLGGNYINGDNIKAIYCSSIELSEDLAEEIQDLDIPLIYNSYGTTEVSIVAVSCQSNPLSMHLLPGMTWAEVVDAQGNLTPSGEVGRVIASRIMSQRNDEITTCNSSQYFFYEIGDEVLVDRSPCQCGRTTPRISQIRRFSGINDNIEGGCQTL
ncbi:AMP-binding protein [Paraneptunicella aestuarii]|uniref:AMP-binding protein n=1 Tax=Paraneptunicella aestuarii TaxID=2831148 RepID=UPI001E33143D|nr:AMP-binding protein [Paraneptunicella aestuarii]UAA37709.1 AMP-binding protein [Paraneptunicella aestuarii]